VLNNATYLNVINQMQLSFVENPNQRERLMHRMTDFSVPCASRSRWLHQRPSCSLTVSAACLAGCSAAAEDTVDNLGQLFKIYAQLMRNPYVLNMSDPTLAMFRDTVGGASGAGGRATQLKGALKIAAGGQELQGAKSEDGREAGLPATASSSN
jgi:hypothetical protein